MPELVLDGRRVTVDAGRTVLDACREHGVAVPTLCHLEGVSPAGSCRVCLVEVEGMPRPLPACATPVWDGMCVATDGETLRRHRRAVVEMLFAGGNHVCAFCPASGDCELQDLAQALGLDHVRLGVPRRAPPVDASHPLFGLDPGRCVLCTRCVRVCAELEGAHTLGVGGRGVGSRITTDGGDGWAGSPTCTDCGRCVEACPTGALFGKARAGQGLAEAARREPAAPPLPRRPPAPGTRALPWAGRAAGARKLRLATVWLGGCSGCHMSLLDVDERLLDLAPRIELVHSPLGHGRRYPGDVDLCLVEGAVAGEDHLALLRRVRQRTRFLVALGDCAGWGNVTALRDAVGGLPPVLARAWPEGERDPSLPGLLERVRAVPEVVDVDLVLPGCPPPADLIHRALSELVAGRVPDLAGTGHFG